MTNEEKRLLALSLVQQAIQLAQEALPADSSAAVHLDHAETALTHEAARHDAPPESH